MGASITLGVLIGIKKSKDRVNGKWKYIWLNIFIMLFLTSTFGKIQQLKI